MPGRILVIDSVSTNRTALKARLLSEYYDLEFADDLGAGWAAILRAPPDAAIINCTLPSGSGYALCSKIKSHPETGHIPVVLVASDKSEVSWSRAYSSYADDIVELTQDFPLIIPRLQVLLRAKASLDELRLRNQTSEDLGLSEPNSFLSSVSLRQVSVVVAGGTTDQRVAAGSVLEKILEARVTDLGRNWAAALDCRTETVVVLGGDDDALRLIARLRSNRASRQVSILYIAPESRVDLSERALAMGANDAFCGSIDDYALASRVRAINNHAALADMLRENVSNGLKLAMVDPLTGLYNRRYAERYLRTAIRRSVETGRSLFVMMLDLDNFKAINDRFGHPAGDAILKAVAERLQGNLRGVDMVARLGGEEFLVVIADITGDRAVEIAQRVRAVIGTCGFDVVQDHPPIPVTISVGLAHAGDGSRNESALLEAADRALYEAKRQGRDRVNFAA